MSNEKIVQVIVKGEQVLGLTETGHLAIFDDNLNAFKIKGRPEVFDRNHQVCTLNPEVNARKSAIVTPAPYVEKEFSERTMWIMFSAVVIVIVAVLIYFF